ncbi:DUF916 domain-containing protein [Candidatus Peregrinibacteria bacterium]|nr:DUF916 domain-containing protein [Candidatus Peregrinibacteria bacterium]
MKTKIITLLFLISYFMPQTMFGANLKFLPNGDNNKFIIETGKTISEEFQLINTSNSKTESVSISFVDGFHTHDGFIAYKLPTEEQKNIGSWTSVDENNNIITLETGEEKTINYKISIPNHATPGSYIGGISILNVKKDQNLKQTGGVVNTRNVYKFIVTIPGEIITDINWSNFRHEHQNEHINLIIDSENKGNTIIKSEGKILIKNKLNNQEESIKINSINLIPNSKTSHNFNFKKDFIANYEITANIKNYEYKAMEDEYELINEESFNTSFYVIPWELITLIVLMITLTILTIVFIHIKNALLRYNSITYHAKHDQSIGDIATEHNINWKKLAKINKLKAPYNLHPDQKILIPKKWLKK